MILYHITTTYQLLNCIEHSIIAESEKKIAVLADFLTYKFPQYQDMLKFGFFDEIYIIKYADIKMVDTFDYELIDNVCNSCIPYDFDEFEEIYIAGIQMWISIFLINNEIPFIAFEEASGGLTRPEILEHNDERISHIRYELMKENHIYDYSNTYIKYVICNIKAQVFIPECKYIDFDPVLNFSNFNQTEKNNILSFFKCPQHVITNGDETIILTQQLANLGVVAFEEQILMYQLFVDYFCNGERIIFKTHPDDQVYYTYLFSNAQVINDKFPSELLPYIFTKCPRKISTIYSTGIYTISQMFNETFELDMNYEYSYKDIYKYDVALRILRNLGCTNVKSEGLDETLLHQMQKNLSDFEGTDITGYITGKEVCEIENFCRYEIIIFFNHSILLKDNFNKMIERNYNIHIINITIKPFRQTDIYMSDTGCEIILAINDRLEKGNGISMKEKFRLQNTGIDIEYDEILGNKFDYEMLKGQLKATEERLKHYIEENDELKKIIHEKGLIE